MQRLRNFRKDQKTRDKYAEVKLSAKDFIYPYFIVDGQNIKKEIKSLNGVYHFSVGKLLMDIEEAISYGLDKFLLFGMIEDSLKDEYGSQAYIENNLVSRAIKEIKKEYPQARVIADVCLCGYTDHGHCGIFNAEDVDNDKTIPLLAKTALTYAQAGADFVAPSSMIDEQVGFIRKILDENGLKKTKILSYSVKYASNFYGPFRGAVNCSIVSGDRSTYQMDYRTKKQALMEVQADIEEGADWIMVKPAHTYLDIIYKLKTKYPGKILVGYQVSGEYMAIKAAAEKGYIDEKKIMHEVLTAIKRAGADYIISYYAKEYVKNLKQKVV